ncbi:MAG: CPBP family intramembrane metalloprotease [Chitinophagaceae bacterium]|nr:MAG: CPBP family intramembrane metalloprotease [Chitinophagaceae bacterium]
MQTYLKSRPVWVQFFIFLGIAAASSLVVLGFGSIVLASTLGIPVREMGQAPSGAGPVSDRVLWGIRMLVLFQFVGLFVLPSLIFAKACDPAPGRYLGLRAPWRVSFWVLGSAALLLALPLVEFTGLLNRQIPFSAELTQKIKFWEESAGRTIQLLLQRHDIGTLALNLLFIAVFAGVGEELFFRGVLQRLLIRGTRSPWAGILLTAAAFSFFHFQFYGFVPRFILGALLGAAYWYSGSLWVSIVAHTLFDAAQLIAAWFRPELATADSVFNASITTLLPAALISAALTGLLLWTMKRHSRSSFTETYADELRPAASENELSI